MVNLPMLWTSLRWNWGNTLAVAGFCLLWILSAVNNVFVFDGRADSRAGEMAACIGLCDNNRQPEVGAPRADAAPATTALLHSQAVTAN